MELLSWNCSWRETSGVQLVESSTTCVLVIYNDIVCPRSSLYCKVTRFPVHGTLKLVFRSKE
jgi:hypothetical protein